MCALILVGQRGRLNRPDKRYKPHKIEQLEPFKPVKDKQYGLIKNYSNMGFNWHSVIRLKRWEDSPEHITKVYNQKMSRNYIDRIMDSLVKRRSIDIAVAFLEQDDYHNNHLHFAWKCWEGLSRIKIANQMKTSRHHIRDIKPIDNIENAIGYFTKRVESAGSYNNIYFNKYTDVKSAVGYNKLT